MLLERHKPRLVYDSHEAYFADSAAIWTDSPTNVLKRADGTVLAKPPKLALGFLGANAYADAKPALTTDAIGDTTRNYAANAAALHQQAKYANRVHGHARKDSQGRLWLQYWLFYYYNDYQLLGPLSGGNHEGDWELVQLRLDAAEQPEQIVFSQHKQAESKAVDGGAQGSATRRSCTSRAARTPTTSARARTGRATGSTRPTARARRSCPRSWCSRTARPRGCCGRGPGATPSRRILPLDSSSPVSPGVRPHWLDPVEARRRPCPSRARRRRPRHRARPCCARPSRRRALRRSAGGDRAGRRAAAQGLGRAGRHARVCARRDHGRGRVARRRPRLRRLDERRRPRGVASAGAKAQ